ncbi:HDL444Wp [Eremothecium sinecaudum]|uniref:DNA helicase n=1 Tax=Eremothecium sinecaudum TaxID=45286 RepID=A0A0X8HRV6_9SACH|nr:HDL444Wp [Eremothecium sinecaudum]AMD20300.1 HDL444Wp [Eremothecium sinecaudum]
MSAEKPDFLKSILDSAPLHPDDKRHLTFNAHEGIAFCIELSSSMYDPCKELDGKPQLLEILESLFELMEQLVAVMPDTGVGCYFFHCAHSESKQGIYELFPLRDINVKNMKKLYKMLESLRLGYSSLEKELPFDDTLPSTLDAVFSQVRDQFLLDLPGQRMYTNKKLFLFTDNDKPTDSKDLESRTRLRKVVDDLNDYYINFTTFFIGSEHPFDESFYADILKLGSTTIPDYTGPSTLPISASYIRSKVLRKKEVKRLRYSCMLTLNEEAGFHVAVKGYALVSNERPGARYRYVYQFEHVQKEAFSRRSYLDPLTAQELKPDDLKRAYQIGDDYLEFSEKDQRLMASSYSPTELPFLNLLGFCLAAEAVHLYDNIQHVTFVTPNDSVYEGSSAALSALYRSLLKKQLVGIIWGKLRTTSMPALFAFVPVQPREGNKQTTRFSEGFYLIRLPFQEELRKFPTPVQTSSSTLLHSQDYPVFRKISMRIIDHLVLSSSYVPAQFKNPAIAAHFRVLAEHLFEEASEDSVKDGHKRNLEKIQELDNTVTRLQALRNRVMADAESALARYLKHWNAFYNRQGKQPGGSSSGSSSARYTKRKKP